MTSHRKFADYRADGHEWITVLESEVYPDFLDTAAALYTPVLERFEQLATESENSADFLRAILGEPLPVRMQLLKVFRRYVSPNTSVEMLKQKRRLEETITGFGDRFRALNQVIENLQARGTNDEALFALLYEYHDRGQKGYDLIEAFFAWFQATFGEQLKIRGPSGPGADIILSKTLDGYDQATPADFIISDESDVPLVVGFGRYDSDRGGAQEDDRIRGNNDSASAIVQWGKKSGSPLRILFLNDGPGLLLGSMWRDYGSLEERWGEAVRVSTLKMLDDRISYEWIAGVNSVT